MGAPVPSAGHHLYVVAIPRFKPFQDFRQLILILVVPVEVASAQTFQIGGAVAYGHLVGIYDVCLPLFRQRFELFKFSVIALIACKQGFFHLRVPVIAVSDGLGACADVVNRLAEALGPREDSQNTGTSRIECQLQRNTGANAQAAIVVDMIANMNRRHHHRERTAGTHTHHQVL